MKNYTNYLSEGWVCEFDKWALSQFGVDGPRWTFLSELPDLFNDSKEYNLTLLNEWSLKLGLEILDYRKDYEDIYFWKVIDYRNKFENELYEQDYLVEIESFLVKYLTEERLNQVLKENNSVSKFQANISQMIHYDSKEEREKLRLDWKDIAALIQTRTKKWFYLNRNQGNK